MERFAVTAQHIGERTGKLEKIALLAEYLSYARRRRPRCSGAFLHRDAVRGARPPYAGDRRSQPSLARPGTSGVSSDAALGRELSLDGRSRRRARSRSCGRRATRCSFATGSRRQRSTRSSARLRRPREKRAGRRREAVLERILRACDDPLIATYVVKIVTGDLRIGLREGLVLGCDRARVRSRSGRRSARCDGRRRRR